MCGAAAPLVPGDLRPPGPAGPRTRRIRPSPRNPHANRPTRGGFLMRRPGRILATAIGATGLLMSALASPALAAPAPGAGSPRAETNAAFYMIGNEKTGRCLALRGSGAELGSAAIQATCNSAAADQFWAFTTAGRLVNYRTGTCLAVRGGSTEGGAVVIHAKCDPPGSDQHWNWGDGVNTQIRNINSGRCLALRGGGAENGVDAIQATCSAHGADQFWTIL
ncbi:hypothetical protein BB341_28915 (plasmid) [Streptomyces clavuligerus]|uniref:Ricin B lectin n=3 Tax=Streptomyces clavuligerus TaxID=1901 RepID=D5SKJ3_STRCL|nr:hypothetical protein BB341_28915 [Streptomyces clavuligerus]AXU17252.1 hypothetical protein D1794_32010 [Streptomyces clavuligerus]EFG04436.1 Ricin B lectin [Streptomyces clavuligerus]QCS10321.1 hypothetical protein CRV15_32710 [Streptomyces clavuligerus]QPJ97635.1 hypothetical protein GE265_31760 [Streptomyces clavuligerus]